MMYVTESIKSTVFDPDRIENGDTVVFGDQIAIMSVRVANNEKTLTFDMVGSLPDRIGGVRIHDRE